MKSTTQKNWTPVASGKSLAHCSGVKPSPLYEGLIILNTVA